jgi:D-glycero-alpha-D-manno-heptose-7-phosphate kinase
MIIVRSPLRISISGGATDLPSFYNKYGGFCISAAINKYVYTLINRPLQEKIILKYSELENIKNVEEVNNPIIKECLKLFNYKTPQIEIITCADIPSSSGLGGSSSFTCSLIKALYSHRNIQILPDEIARIACDIEINKLNGNLGKQDQYISAYGGLQCMTFNQDETVKVEPLDIEYNKMLEFQDSLLLFYTGYSHSTNDVLKDQVEKTKLNNKDMIENLLKVKEMAFEGKKLLESGDIQGYGKLTHEHWMNKRKRSIGMSNNQIDEWYNFGIDNGAYGGKLVGSGGSGGFLLFIAEDIKKLRKAMNNIGLEELRFIFDFSGVKQIV